MKPFRTLAILSTLGAALAAPAMAGPMIWASMGEEAYQLLRDAKAPMEQVTSRRLPVSVPDANGKLATRMQPVYLLRVDEDALPRLSSEVHEKLNRCGGYIFHSSRAAGLQALARFAQPPRAPMAPPSYDIDNADTVNALMPLLQESQIRSTIVNLSQNYKNRFYTTSYGVSASDDLAKTWKQLAKSRTDVTVKQFAHPQWPQKSVILTITGTSKPKEIVVVGGHMDSTIGNTGENSIAPGADDDASGVASLQEVMRVLLANDYKPRRTLQFIAYAAEEVGLRGSSEIAANYKAKGKKVVGALQLDMTNYQGSTNDVTMITDFTNAAQNNFVKSLAAFYLPTLVVSQSACGYACSDHASWTNQGYVASFPFEAQMGQHNPFIHTAQDTIDKSGNTANHAIKFSRLALAYLVELGSDGPTAAVSRKDARSH